MKNIKLRIVYLILGAALLLFALFMLAVNLIIPAHFVSEAKKALISEDEYRTDNATRIGIESNLLRLFELLCRHSIA